MATVNADGSPHNTPYFFLHSPDLRTLYWGSSTESLHSQNVARTGQVFVVLYDADKGGGLYIQAGDAHATEGTELSAALEVHNAKRLAEGKAALSSEYYSGDGPQRMYMATVEKFWVNAAERDSDGHIIRDVRHEIQRTQLLPDEGR